MGESDARLTRHLLAQGTALQLRHDLVHLTKPRSSDGLTVRDAATIGIHREPATDEIVAPRVTGALLTRCAQAGLSEVHDLGAAFGILHLGNVDVLRTNSRRGEGS